MSFKFIVKGKETIEGIAKHQLIGKHIHYAEGIAV